MGKDFADEISFADDTAPSPAPAPPRLTVVPPPADQDKERVCPEGAARAASDERIAKSLGFSPAPPVFEIGTVVNSIGVANFKRSRQEWATMPSLPELARTFTDRVAAEQRTDSVVNAHQITMLPSGELRVDGEIYLTSERAIEGLATHVTPGGAGYLRACPPELRSANLNHWLGQAFVKDARASKTAGTYVQKARQLTLRKRARKGGRREVYAACGPKYAAFNVDRVVREAAAAIGGDARGLVTYDGYRMTMDAMFHSNIVPHNAVAGEFFKATIRVQAADDGSGAVKVKLGLWRNLCRNLIIVDFDTVLIGSRRHVGEATIEADIRELLTTADERIQLIVGKWSEASTEDVLARYDLTDVDEVFRGLVVNRCVEAPGVKGEDLIKRLHTAWEREPGYSKTAILNAITRAAHENTWSSWADAEDLESQAGELLYQKVWNLDYSERTAEEVLA